MTQIIDKAENSLLYIGYTAGILLLLENMAKILRYGDAVGIKIALFSFFLWGMSFISRSLVFSKYARKMKPIQKVRLELLYFILCHTFTMVFVSTIMKYTPVRYGVGYYTYTQFEEYSGMLNYFTKSFIFLFFVQMLFFASFMWFIFSTSKIFYKIAVGKAGYYSGDTKKMTVLQVFSIAFMLVITLVVMNIPGVWYFMNFVNLQLGFYLKTNFQWLADYIIGSPVLYFVYASFKGSDLAEGFSLFRKVV